MGKRFHQFLLLAFCALFILTPSLGWMEQSIEYTSQGTGEAQVRYPVLIGMDNLFAMQSVNDAIFEKGQLGAHLNTLAAIQGGMGGKLQVEGKAEIFPSDTGHHLLTVHLLVRGRLPSGRNGSQHTPLMFDLANGQQIHIDAFLIDKDHAQEMFNQLALDSLEDQLSNYLDTSNLVPVPIDNALPDAVGIRFYYSADKLSLLSGNAASFRFLYHEIEDILKLSEGSLLSDLHLAEYLKVRNDSADRIRQSVLAGRLPGIGTALSDDLKSLLDKEQLAFDPEGFAQGKKYQLEDDAYRGTCLVSQDEKTVSGLFSKRMNLFGLMVGKTNKNEVVEVFPEHEAEARLEEAAAALYGIQPGTSLLYEFDDKHLQMFFDQEDELQAIYLSLAN